MHSAMSTLSRGAATTLRGKATPGSGETPLRIDCTISARLRFNVVKGQTYIATFASKDSSGVVLNRRLTIQGT